jgi:hypothetical protein
MPVIPATQETWTEESWSRSAGEKNSDTLPEKSESKKAGGQKKKSFMWSQMERQPKEGEAQGKKYH